MKSIGEELKQRRTLGSPCLKGNIVQSVVAVVIIVTSSAIVINLLTSTTEEGTAVQEFEKGKQLMTTIDAVIQELLFEASGSRRTIDVVSDFGFFEVVGSTDALKFTVDSPTSLIEPGTSVVEGNLLITSGPSMQAYESDIDSNGVTDLVLENNAVLFAVRKVGGPANYTTLNMSDIITRINNKRVSVNVSPQMQIFVDDALNTSYGNGYTELTQTGNLISSGVRVVMNSTSGRAYDVLFTLSSGRDFLELEVRNVR